MLLGRAAGLYTRSASMSQPFASRVTRWWARQQHSSSASCRHCPHSLCRASISQAGLVTGTSQLQQARLCVSTWSAQNSNWRSSSVLSSPPPYPSARPPPLSTDVSTASTRCAIDSTLPPPPPFPILSPPLPPRSARFVSDLLFTPPALRVWSAYSSDVHCPLLVDHANLLLALAHVTAGRKAKRRLRHAAAVTYEQQKRQQSAEELSALEVRARRAIDGALRSGGTRLTPLPGWTQQDVLAVRAVRGERGRQHLRWAHPRFTHHQLKMVDVIERHRQHRDSSEHELQREAQQHRVAASQGSKAWKVERAERGYVSPAKWRVPRHLRWLMWKRRQARQQAEARASRQQLIVSSGAVRS